MVDPIVNSVVEGVHGTVFAYGQTSCGKTYTMQGHGTTPGILQMAVLGIFEKIESCPDREFLFRVSYIEIYNEVVRDLLCNKEYVVNTTCVVLLAGVSFAISGILDSVVTSNDERFDDDDASYVNYLSLYSTIISHIQTQIHTHARALSLSHTHTLSSDIFNSCPIFL